jgi:hypothetical protein
MKKFVLLSIYCLLYYCSSAQLTEAQRVGKLNITTENKTGELLATDPLIGGKLYYKAAPISLKKGMGAVFFMQSNAFIPLIFLLTPQGKEFGTPGSRASKEGQEATISFIADSDTSFYVMLTSGQENKTGSFTYGFRILNPDQMIFNKNFNACQKIDYLINHWQLNWELISTTKESDEYKATAHTLAGEGSATITGGYQEKIYTGTDTSSAMAKFHYDKFCGIVEACISPAVWITQAEKKETTGLISTTHYITHFFLKGAKPDEAKKSFKMIRKLQWTVLGNAEVEVLLIFN